jgi:hypothetical protein
MNQRFHERPVKSLTSFLKKRERVFVKDCDLQIYIPQEELDIKYTLPRSIKQKKNNEAIIPLAQGAEERIHMFMEIKNRLKAACRGFTS